MTRDHQEAIAAVLAREAQRREALVSRDIAALENLFTDDLVHVHASGQIDDKPRLIRQVRDGVFRFVDIARGPLHVRLYDRVAVMTGTMTNTLQGKDTSSNVVSQLHVTQVWILTPDGWKQSSFQSTRLPAQ
jgi:ketosteroid isomerase-like protein